MAFTQKDYDDDSNFQTSKFNEAFLKMHRIHRLQDTMNISGMNPLAFNNDLGVFNYQAKVSACDGILMEVWGKLEEDERKEAMQLKNVVENFMELHPVFQEKFNRILGKSKFDIDYASWNVLKKAIFRYETKVRELLSRTGYDSPNQDFFGEDEL